MAVSVAVAYIAVVPVVVGLKVATLGVPPGVIIPIGLVWNHFTSEMAIPGAGVKSNPIVSAKSISAVGVVVDMVFENKGKIILVGRKANLATRIFFNCPLR